jgi:hypothetical protein
VGHAGALTGSLAAKRNMSAHTPITIEVLKRSFFNNIGIRSMAPTFTLHSVTPKHLLLATISDQVRLCAPCPPAELFLLH